MLLFMNDPSKSLPVLIEIIDKCGTFSGLKINYNRFLTTQIVSIYLPFKVANNRYYHLETQFTLTGNADLLKEDRFCRHPQRYCCIASGCSKLQSRSRVCILV